MPKTKRISRINRIEEMFLAIPSVITITINSIKIINTAIFLVFLIKFNVLKNSPKSHYPYNEIPDQPETAVQQPFEINSFQCALLQSTGYCRSGILLAPEHSLLNAQMVSVWVEKGNVK